MKYFVHIVCNEIQVKVNLEITTFFFYLRFPYCPNFFWFGVVVWPLWYHCVCVYAAKMTPAKQSQLRNFLSKRQTPPVRSTAPGTSTVCACDVIVHLGVLHWWKIIDISIFFMILSIAVRQCFAGCIMVLVLGCFRHVMDKLFILFMFCAWLMYKEGTFSLKGDICHLKLIYREFFPF